MLSVETASCGDGEKEWQCRLGGGNRRWRKPSGEPSGSPWEIGEESSPSRYTDLENGHSVFVHSGTLRIFISGTRGETTGDEVVVDFLLSLHR